MGVISALIKLGFNKHLKQHLKYACLLPSSLSKQIHVETNLENYGYRKLYTARQKGIFFNGQ